MDRHLKLKRMLNTRDLGGLRTKDGRTVKSGLLYRSGFLYVGAEEDIEMISTLGISKIIDFRAYNEKEEKPDPVIPGVEFIHLPAEDEAVLGIERDRKTQQGFTDLLMSRVITEPAFAIRYMSGMYRRFVSNRFTTGQYRKFLDIVRTADGPVLWHCTAGKDRAGFAAILLEEILGIDRDDIIESYMLSNTYLQPDVEYLVREFEKAYRGSAPYPKKEVMLFFSARKEFVDALYNEAEKEFGSFENFLASELGVDDGVREEFREKYLE